MKMKSRMSSVVVAALCCGAFVGCASATHVPPAEPVYIPTVVVSGTSSGDAWDGYIVVDPTGTTGSATTPTYTYNVVVTWSDYLNGPNTYPHSSPYSLVTNVQQPLHFTFDDLANHETIWGKAKATATGTGFGHAAADKPAAHNP